MTNYEIADSLSKLGLRMEWNGHRQRFALEHVPLAISNLVTFAIETLNTMNRPEDWNADTLDEIRDKAELLNLTAPDEGDGMFHSIFDT